MNDRAVWWLLRLVTQRALRGRRLARSDGSCPVAQLPAPDYPLIAPEEQQLKLHGIQAASQISPTDSTLDTYFRSRVENATGPNFTARYDYNLLGPFRALETLLEAEAAVPRPASHAGVGEGRGGTLQGLFMGHFGPLNDAQRYHRLIKEL